MGKRKKEIEYNMEYLKKIFIITPHFPPSALPPSQRARLLVKHFESLGYYPYVFSSDNKYREEQEDIWMTELVGTNFDLIKVKTLNPRITRKFGVGDLGIRMLPFLYKKLIKKSKELKPDFILYLVPPWYLLTIAKKIKKQTNVPYGIDFIDPWLVPSNLNTNFKKKISQKIAKIFEKKATKNADIIYSVSEGINENLIKFHSLEKNKPMFAIPYGVEPSDFDIKVAQNNYKEVVFRYIGAVWNDAYPVLEPLLKTLSEIEKEVSIKIEFYGTSYATEGLAKPQTHQWIEKFSMQKYFTEKPLRVSYKKAIELTMSADIILLFGGMQPYYAASKLMGLIASGKPFFAFLHKESFPAKFLKNLNYKYLVQYSQEELPETKAEEIKSVIQILIEEKDNFIKFDMNNPLIQKHTAFGMTKAFIQPIENLLKQKT